MTLSVGIFGAGALGSGVGYLLQQQGHRVTLIGRYGVATQQVAVFTEDHSAAALRSQQDGSLWDIAFITTKAPQAEAAILSALPKLKPQAVVVPLCNGLLAEDIKTLRMDKERIRLGVATIGARWERHGALQLSGLKSGGIFWGAGDSSAPQTAEQEILQPQKYFFWDSDIAARQRQKWFFNTVANTLAGVYQLPCNGVLLSWWPVVEKLGREVFELGEWRWGKWPETCEDLLTKLRILLQATAANENSMAVDMRLRRSNESAFLSGRAVGAPLCLPLLKKFHSVLVAGVV